MWGRMRTSRLWVIISHTSHKAWDSAESKEHSALLIHGHNWRARFVVPPRLNLWWIGALKACPFPVCWRTGMLNPQQDHSWAMVQYSVGLSWQQNMAERTLAKYQIYQVLGYFTLLYFPFAPQGLGVLQNMKLQTRHQRKVLITETLVMLHFRQDSQPASTRPCFYCSPPSSGEQEHHHRHGEIRFCFCVRAQ